jgi:hypothetical protein
MKKLLAAIVLLLLMATNVSAMHLQIRSGHPIASHVHSTSGASSSSARATDPPVRLHRPPTGETIGDWRPSDACVGRSMAIAGRRLHTPGRPKGNVCRPGRCIRSPIRRWRQRHQIAECGYHIRASGELTGNRRPRGPNSLLTAPVTICHS